MPQHRKPIYPLCRATGDLSSSLFQCCGVLFVMACLTSHLTAAEVDHADGSAARVVSTGTDQARPSGEKTQRTVSLTIDYGDGFQKRYPQVAWREKMTVGDLLRAAQQHRRGIELTVRGRGKMSLLVQIDDLKNQGGRGLNWVYRINGKLSDRSFEVHSLQAGDAVLWKFDKYR